MKTRYPRRSRSEWVKIIEQQSQSGLTIRAFCDQTISGWHRAYSGQNDQSFWQ